MYLKKPRRWSKRPEEHKMASNFKPYFTKFCKPESNKFEKDFRKAVLCWLETELLINRVAPVKMVEMIDRELRFYPIITNEHGSTYVKHELNKALNELSKKWWLNSLVTVTLDMRG